MEIPAHIRILASIRIGSVYYFKEESLSSEESHFFIVLNKDPRTEEFLILVCASSQVKKRQDIGKKLGFPPESLVIVSPAEYPLFKKETVIDCNSVFEKTSQSLIDKLESGSLKVCTEIMPAGIVQKLIQGVLMSWQVAEKVQDALRQQSS
jgi:hypothetical protein